MACSPTSGTEGFHASFWANIVGNYDKTSPKVDAYRDRRFKFLMDNKYLKQDDEVLDFACATGRLAMDMSPHVGSVLGIDLSERMIALAKEKEASTPGGNVKFGALDIFDPSLDQRRFSVVFAMNVFHLVPDPSVFVRRMRAITAPGALLIAETPCMASQPWYLRALIGAAGWTGLVPSPDFWTKEGIEGMVQREGFELVKGLVLEGGDPLLVARRTD